MRFTPPLLCSSGCGVPVCVCRYAYAIYCIIMVAVFVVGMPAGILYALSRHRFTLFGPASQSTRKRLGFLYHM